LLRKWQLAAKKEAALPIRIIGDAGELDYRLAGVLYLRLEGYTFEGFFRWCRDTRKQDEFLGKEQMITETSAIDRMQAGKE